MVTLPSYVIKALLLTAGKSDIRARLNGIHFKRNHIASTNGQCALELVSEAFAFSKAFFIKREHFEKLKGDVHLDEVAQTLTDANGLTAKITIDTDACMWGGSLERVLQIKSKHPSKDCVWSPSPNVPFNYGLVARVYEAIQLVRNAKRSFGDFGLLLHVSSPKEAATMRTTGVWQNFPLEITGLVMPLKPDDLADVLAEKGVVELPNRLRKNPYGWHSQKGTLPNSKKLHYVLR